MLLVKWHCRHYGLKCADAQLRNCKLHNQMLAVKLTLSERVRWQRGAVFEIRHCTYSMYSFSVICTAICSTVACRGRICLEGITGNAEVRTAMCLASDSDVSSDISLSAINAGLYAGLIDSGHHGLTADRKKITIMLTITARNQLSWCPIQSQND